MFTYDIRGLLINRSACFNIRRSLNFCGKRLNDFNVFIDFIDRCGNLLSNVERDVSQIAVIFSDRNKLLDVLHIVR